MTDWFFETSYAEEFSHVQSKIAKWVRRYGPYMLLAPINNIVTEYDHLLGNG
jgi:hypothetical protein